MDKDREFTGLGLFNDFVANLMKIAYEPFRQDKLRKYEINHKGKVDPDKVDIPDLPALFVWLENADGNNLSVGQQREKELSEKIEIQSKVRYVSHKVDGEDKAEEVREVAGVMFEHLVANKNVNDISKITNVGQFDFSTSLLFVDGKLQPVDGFQVPITCTFSKRMQQSTRRTDSKYTP